MLTFNKLGSEDLLTTKEAAALSGYSTDYIGQLAREGRIEAKRIKKSWHISKQSLLKYKEDNKKILKLEEKKDSLAESSSIPEPKVELPRILPAEMPAVETASAHKKHNKIHLVKVPLVHRQFSGKKLVRLHNAIQSGSLKASKILGSASSVVPPKDFWHKALSLMTAIVLVFGSYFFIESGAHVALARSFDLLAERSEKSLYQVLTLSIENPTVKISTIQNQFKEKIIIGALTVKIAEEEISADPFGFMLRAGFSFGRTAQNFVAGVGYMGDKIVEGVKGGVMAAVTKR